MTERFVEWVEQVPYLTHPLHALLAPDVGEGRGPNIGRNGSNLTISFLSLDRVALSERLVTSIAKHLAAFEGEVLVVDNGSQPETRDRLRKALAELNCRTRLVALDANYGVAGGRNRTLEHVRTDWVLFLDNDIYFVDNPLAAIQRDLSRLGCHYLNVPLLDGDERTLFARGGHLYLHVEDGLVHIGAGSACEPVAVENTDGSAFLNTFLYGGASVVRAASLVAEGGFDEGMFIGFEDIDLSVRLFRAGQKIGTCGRVALVHDHPPPSDEADRDYERSRFAREAIEKSARYLEAKYGFCVWTSDVARWLEERHRTLSLTESAEAVPSVSTEADRPIETPRVEAGRTSIALIVDVEAWAFGNIARQIERLLADSFRVQIIPADWLETDIVQTLLLTKDSELTHFFWREHLPLIDAPYTRARLDATAGGYDEFVRRYVRPRALSTCVYDHLFLDDEAAAARRRFFADMVDGYYVCSNRLSRTYSTLNGYPAPLAVIPDGVDVARFRTGRGSPSRDANEPLVVGWAGNSTWGGERDDAKGVRTILRPAIERLQAAGVPIVTRFADRAERHIAHADMPAYYRSIDVCVCTSRIEGTPNPVLEAMASGRAVVSTDVGIVPDAFGEKQSEFIIERSIEALESALRRLAADRALVRELGAENERRIETWDWDSRRGDFRAYFEAVMRRHAERVG